MYAQVSSITLQPGKVDEWLAITRDAILPAAQERPGFVSALILVDREKHTGIGISLWETEADVEAVASSGFYQEQWRRWPAASSVRLSVRCWRWPSTFAAERYATRPAAA